MKLNSQSIQYQRMKSKKNEFIKKNSTRHTRQ
jgi:hypothetical protein